ncbi:ABC transporter permease [Paenibacillus sp. SYP-B3998]|uniref:ABC transporter permease n=1 Tax=Paenibacillus sp. SYP-B3998 TaxID=2678564 RepID=A0A6G3ZT77_9BACL|nr:ABC transporter permease [Paenibacillus sp. SYP-B3998]NEW04791.1 ABC transporter permease [Paenibacillus sp. SYP-B3998]
MKRLFQSEWERMWKRKKTKVSLLLLMLIVCFDCLFLNMQRVGAFNASDSVPLVAQNFSVFLLKEVSFFLTLIIGPLLIVDSLNGENTSGQLRLVLIRPISIAKLFLAKWLNLACMLFLFVSLTFVIGEAFGHLLLPSVDSLFYLNPTNRYDSLGAFMYGLKSYGLFFLILLAELSIVCLICTLLPNAIISYFIWIGVMIGTLYVSDSLQFFLLSASTIFKLMADRYAYPFYLPLGGCIGFGFLVTMAIWNRKNWSK